MFFKTFQLEGNLFINTTTWNCSSKAIYLETILCAIFWSSCDCASKDLSPVIWYFKQLSTAYFFTLALSVSYFFLAHIWSSLLTCLSYSIIKVVAQAIENNFFYTSSHAHSSHAVIWSDHLLIFRVELASQLVEHIPSFSLLERAASSASIVWNESPQIWIICLRQSQLRQRSHRLLQPWFQKGLKFLLQHGLKWLSQGTISL